MFCFPANCKAPQRVTVLHLIELVLPTHIFYLDFISLHEYFTKLTYQQRIVPTSKHGLCYCNIKMHAAKSIASSNLATILTTLVI